MSEEQTNKCDNCHKYSSNLKNIFFTFKTSRYREPERWCKLCRLIENDDFCNSCGANTGGSNPCRDCKYELYSDE